MTPFTNEFKDGYIEMMFIREGDEIIVMEIQILETALDKIDSARWRSTSTSLRRRFASSTRRRAFPPR